MNVQARITLLALALAIPAWLLTASASFTPLEQRATLSGTVASWAFTLDAPEWLYLESDLTLRAPVTSRPLAVVSVNDLELMRTQPASLYVTERSRTLIPMSHVRAGENTLRVRIDGDASATFTMNLRVQNYHGINPRFPRAVVVADETVATAAAARGAARMFDLLLLSIAAFGFVWVADRALGRVADSSATVIFGPPAVILWVGVLYCIATPYYLWLSREALLTLIGGPALLSAIAVWLSRHLHRLWRPALAATLGIALSEVGLRVANWINPTPIFYTESSGRYRGRPGAPFQDTRLNSRGFNDIERVIAKPAHVRRIVAIGDSVAFGVVPRRHNYLSQLETELAKDRATEVINMGVPGTAPKDYLALLVEEGLSFSPDLVLVGFYIGNDFESRAKRVHEHSYAATLGVFLWRIVTGTAPGTVWFESSSTAYDNDAPTFEYERFLEIQVSRAEIYRNERLLREAATRAIAYLREMRDLAAQAGADLLVVVIPDEVQVDRTLQERIVHARAVFGRDQFDFMRPNRVIAEELSRLGIPHYDLTPVFQDAAPAGPLYKPQDTHWNIAGNRLAATALANYLRGAGR